MAHLAGHSPSAKGFPDLWVRLLHSMLRDITPIRLPNIVGLPERVPPSKRRKPAPPEHHPAAHKRVPVPTDRSPQMTTKKAKAQHASAYGEASSRLDRAGDRGCAAIRCSVGCSSTACLPACRLRERPGGARVAAKLGGPSSANALATDRLLKGGLSSRFASPSEGRRSNTQCWPSEEMRSTPSL